MGLRMCLLEGFKPSLQLWTKARVAIKAREASLAFSVVGVNHGLENMAPVKMQYPPVELKVMLSPGPSVSGTMIEPRLDTGISGWNNDPPETVKIPWSPPVVAVKIIVPVTN
jgi:hypothetical protein